MSEGSDHRCNRISTFASCPFMTLTVTVAVVNSSAVQPISYVPTAGTEREKVPLLLVRTAISGNGTGPLMK